MSESINSLYWACYRGKKDFVLQLTNFKSVRYVDPDLGDTPLHQACRQGWLDIVKLLIETYGCDSDLTSKCLDQSPLHYACRYGHIDVVEYLVNKQHLNPLLRDNINLEPLDHALNNSRTDIAVYICQNCISSGELLNPNRIKTTVNLIKYIVRVNPFDPKWITADGNSIIQLVGSSKSFILQASSAVVLKILTTNAANDIIPFQPDWRTGDGDNVIMPGWTTADGDTVLQLVCQSKICLSQISSAMLLMWLRFTILYHVNISLPDSKTADGDPLLQLVCQSKAAVSRISSAVLSKWLRDTTHYIRLANIIVPDWKTADGDTLLQLVCQSKICLSQISSAMLLMWLRFTILYHVNISLPDSKTADGDPLLQLVCQSKAAVSRISSAVLSKWLRDTTHYIRLANIIVPDWKTADGDTLLQLVCQSKICLSQISSAMLLMWLRFTILYHVNISLPDSKTADGDPLLQLVCQSKAAVSRISSAVLSKWLRDTTHYIRLANIIVPDWKTADGDTLLQLVCESETCLSRISSAVLLMWLRIITLDHVNISLPDSKTANGDTLLQLACQLPTTISRISSAVLLKWLRDTTLCVDYLVEIVKLEWKTADGNTLLQLVCQSETTASQISSPVLSKWLRYTTLNLAKIIIPQRKTADGDTLLQLVCESETCLSRISSVTLLKWLHITVLYHVNISLPDSKTADGDTLLHLILQSAMTISQTSSTVLSKWLSDSSEVTIDRMKMINPNWKTLDGDCFFHALCQSKIEDKQLIELIQYYMRKDGLNPDILDSKKNTALHIACRADKPALVSFLLNEAQCDPSIRNKKEKLPLDMTTNPEVINYLCQHDQVSVFSNTVTRWMNNKAIDNTKMMGILKLFVDNYGNNTIDGSTLLHLTCKPCSGNSKFRDKIRLIHYLLTEGHSDPNCLDSKGRMPLQLTSDSTIMKKLIEHGAKMTADVVFKMISSEHITDSTAIELFTLSTRKGTMLWNPNDLNIDGYSALHLACKAGSPTKVNLVLSVAHCDPNINSKFHDKIRLIHYLLTEGHSDPNCLDSKGRMPLQLTSDSTIMKKLIEHGAKMTADVVFKMISSEHITGSTAIELFTLSTRKGTMLWNPNDLNIDGYSALHLACKAGSPTKVNLVLSVAHCDPNINSKFRDKIRLIHYLLTEGHSDPNCLDSKGRMPLQLTSDSTIMKKLIEHGAKMTVDVVFKMISSEHITGSTAIELFTLSTRKGTMLWNPNDLNIDGYSALHLACKAGSPTKVNLVLSVAHCDPNIKSNNEEVPLQMTTNPEIIKNLIRHGAKTSIMYESCQNTLGTNEPVKPPVKVFIVGNPSVGKSSLTAALKKKLNIVARFFTSGKVSGVDQKTVGIVPHEVESDIYGRVTLYDFAGHREFYSGHAALLQTAIQSTPPVFLLVVNLYQDDDAITKDIMYWISFLENQCASVNCKPHIILVGSHADFLKSRGTNSKDKIKEIVDSLDTKCFINMKLVGFVAMDCQYHESSGMSDLRRLLIKSCSELRIPEPITFNAHCFLVYLIDTFKDSPAVTINTVYDDIENAKSLTEESVINFLPHNFEALYKICIELNDRGHILLLKDRINAENSYIVIYKTFLLSKISGTVFAPEGFRQHTQLSTNTGVVPRSKLADSFPGKDINIVIGFLNHLEFCHEVSDQALHQLISEQYSQTYDDNERYYLFPALISVNAKDSLWKTESHFGHNFGWIIQCYKDEQFFSSRFLQVLLLRLAFSFALKVSGNDHKFGIHRKCSIWKNGIFWGRNFNMDVLVEVNDSKSVVIMARFGTSNLLKCIKHRSEVIQTVLECIKQFCPRIETVESFIDSSSILQYPFALNSGKTHCIVQDLCEALASTCKCPSVVLSDSGKSMSAEKFLSFEPYSEIAISTLYELWDKEAENNVVSEDFIVRFFRHASSKLAEWFVRIFIESADIPSSRDDLIHELIKWRDNDTTQQKTYKDLRQKLDQYSVFAGRNILVNSKMKATLLNFIHY